MVCSSYTYLHVKTTKSFKEFCFFNSKGFDIQEFYVKENSMQLDFEFLNCKNEHLSYLKQLNTYPTVFFHDLSQQQRGEMFRYWRNSVDRILCGIFPRFWKGNISESNDFIEMLWQ